MGDKDMGERIFREETVQSLRDCVMLAAERHGFPLAEHLRDNRLTPLQDLSNPYKARFLFDGLLKAIDWSDRDDIRPIVGIFEDAYAESPKSFSSLHQKIDVELARDGYRIKNGQLLRLVI